MRVFGRVIVVEARTATRPRRVYVCVCEIPRTYLLQHHSLLLLEQGLELLWGEHLLLEDLLHLLRCDHLRTHHGHGHWNLDRDDERKERKGVDGRRTLICTRNGFGFEELEEEMEQQTCASGLVAWIYWERSNW